jgi:hypothetical protein
MAEHLRRLPLGVRWLLTALVLVLLIIVLALVVTQIQAVAESARHSWLSELLGQSAGQPCLRDAANFNQPNICSANDVRISALELIEGPEICTPGEEIEVKIAATLLAGSSERYDVGLYIAEDGGDAVERGSTCFRDYVHPVSSTNGDLDLSGGFGPFYNGELTREDTCGDIQQDATAFYHVNENESITIICDDSDGNGIADIGTVVTWDINEQTDCSDESDTVPDQTSKCRAGSIDISGLLVPKTAHIEVIKDLTPSDDDMGRFNLFVDETAWAEDVGNMGSTDKVTVTAGTNVDPGDTYRVAETAGLDTVLPDYDVALTCVYRGTTDLAGEGSGPGPHDVAVEPDDDIVCTFANVLKKGPILFEKRVVGGSALPSEWTFTADGQTAGHGESLSLYIGGYLVTEDGGAENDATYALTDAGGVCALENEEIQLTVTPVGGTCTVTNTRLTGSLDVVKLVADESKWTLAYSGPTTNSGDVGNGGHLGPDTVPTGEYSVTENPATGTDGSLYSSSGSCSGATGNGTASADGRTISGIIVGEGDTVECTFTNSRKTGTLELAKTVADETQWTLTYSGPDSNSEDVGGGGSLGPDTVRTGTYTVSEAAASGTDGSLYTSTGVCSGATDNGSLSADGRTITGVIIGEVDAVVCAFTNTRKTGTLEVVKSVADESQWTLTYSGPDGSSGDVGDGGSLGPDTVRTGTYTILEAPASGTDGALYASTGTCSGATDNGELATDGRSISGIVVDYGDQVVCTFTNLRRPGGIVILKQTDPPDLPGAFSFGSNTPPVSFSLAHDEEQTFADLPADSTYAFTETVPTGWELKEITCSGQESSSVETGDTWVSILLAPNEDIICTFVDEAVPSIEIVKTAEPTSVMEPGGTVTYTVEVSNSSVANVPVELTELEDAPYGDLSDGGNTAISNSTCQVGATIQQGSSYTCTFQAEVSGKVGDEIEDTVTATAQSESGRKAQASDPATVTIIPAPPIGIRVSKTADPEVVYAPEGDVKYWVGATNESDPRVPVTLTDLVDDIYGDLADGDNSAISNSTCEIEVTIQPGDTYRCSFEATVRGEVGDTVTDIVTATALDEREREVTASDDATVTLVTEPPDTGVALPMPLAAAGLAMLGAGLLLAVVVYRGWVVRTGH